MVSWLIEMDVYTIMNKSCYDIFIKSCVSYIMNSEKLSEGKNRII